MYNPEKPSFGAEEQGNQRLSPDEARKHAWAVFPDNPRAAFLLERELLGKITDEEKRELNRYFQLRCKFEQRSRCSLG